MAHVAPMLLSTTHSAPTGGDWVLEPKWDGFRFLYRLSRGGEVGCWARHGNHQPDADEQGSSLAEERLP